MINYSAADLIPEFTVNQAAMLWCDTSKITEENVGHFLLIQTALVQAIQRNKLKAIKIPKKLVERRINGGLYDMEEPHYEIAIVSRKALISWAERNNQKPKFLFSEARTESDTVPQQQGTLITQYNITADHVVVTPSQKLDIPSNSSPKKPSSTARESEMHKLIERVYIALCKELRAEPSSKQVMNAIESRQDEFDKGEIVQEVLGDTILWISARGHEQRLKLASLQNIVSKIRNSQKVHA